MFESHLVYCTCICNLSFCALLVQSEKVPYTDEINLGSNFALVQSDIAIYSEVQWSCKRSPDYFPGITTTVKQEKGGTLIL